jgi:hypothetical protein
MATMANNFTGIPFSVVEAGSMERARRHVNT